MDTLYEKLAPYAYYFEVLQKKVISLAVVFGIVFIATFIESGAIIHGILKLFNLDNVTIATTSPFQLLHLSTTIAMITSMTSLFLMLTYHSYVFMKDGLRKKERRLFFYLLIAGLVLFATGVLYGFGVLYFYLVSVSKMNIGIGITNMWDITTFLSQMIFTSIFLGFIFQFPIILTFMIRTGMVSTQFLRAKRKIAFIAIFVFVGFLPPPDIFSTFIEAFPLLVLYELAIRVNSGSIKNRHESIVPVIE